MMAESTNPIMQANVVRQRIADSIGQVQENNAAQQASIQHQGELTKIIGDADAVIAQQAAVSTQRVEQANQKAGADFSVNPDAQGYLINKLAQDANKAYGEMLVAEEAYNKKLNTSFMEDPLGWLMGKITINDDAMRYNAAENRRDMALQQADKLNQSFQSQARTNAALKVSVTAASTAAEADKLKATTDREVEKYKLTALQAGNAGMKQVLELSKDDLNILFSTESLKLQRSNHQLALEAAARARDEHEYKMGKIKDEKEAYSHYVEKVNEGMRIAYGDKAQFIHENSVEAKQTFEAVRNGRGVVNEQIQKLYLIGTQGIFGGTPAQALDTVFKVNANLTPGVKQTAETLKSIRDNMPAPMIPPGATKEEKDRIMRSQFESRVKQELELQAGNVTSTSDNLFYPGSMKTIMEGAAQNPKLAAILKSSPVVQKILIPGIAAGQTFDNPSQVNAAVLAGIKSGAITYTDAVDYVPLLYQFGVEANNKSKGFVQMGIPETRSYNTKVRVSPNVFGSETIDMTNRLAYSRLLSRSLAVQSSIDAASGSTLVNPFAPMGNIDPNSLRFGPEITFQAPGTPSPYNPGQK